MYIFFLHKLYKMETNKKKARYQTADRGKIQENYKVETG